MGRVLKYIVYNKGNLDFFVVAPEIAKHVDFVPRTVENEDLLSAGFCKVYYTGQLRLHPETFEAGYQEVRVRCYGRSVSLGLESRPKEDSKLLTRYITLF